MISIKEKQSKIFKSVLFLASALVAGGASAECKIGQECWSETLLDAVAPACTSAIEESLNRTPYHSYRWVDSDSSAPRFKAFSVTGGKRFLFMGDAIHVKSNNPDAYDNGKERGMGRFFYIGNKDAVGEFVQHSYACGISIDSNADGEYVNLSFDKSKVDIMMQPGDIN